MLSRQRSVLLFACVLVVSACAGSRPRPDELSGCVGPLTGRGKVVRPDPKSIDDLEKRTDSRPSDGKFDVLCLSGGGRSGAWGAGVLNGWLDHDPQKFPKFDLVTGVSTGALMATHAFLGEPSDIHRIGWAYTQIPGERLIETHSMLRGVLGNGLTSLTPLRRTLPSFLTTDDIDRVAQVEDRVLYIGTVDLDCGELVIWDMKALAKRHDYCRYWDVVVASCVAPAFTEPWFIDGRMHVDGGTRQQIFLPPLVNGAFRHYLKSNAAKDRKNRMEKPDSRLTLEPDSAPTLRPDSRPDEGTVYAIVNGGLGVYGHVVDNSFLPIALRGAEVLMDEAEITALRLIESYATEGRSTPLPAANEQTEHAGKLKFRLSYVPAKYRSDVQTLDFDLGERRRLYAHAYAWGMAGTPEHNWTEHVPPSPSRNEPPEDK